MEFLISCQDFVAVTVDCFCFEKIMEGALSIAMSDPTMVVGGCVVTVGLLVSEYKLIVI